MVLLMFISLSAKFIQVSQNYLILIYQLSLHQCFLLRKPPSIFSLKDGYFLFKTSIDFE